MHHPPRPSQRAFSQSWASGLCQWQLWYPQILIKGGTKASQSPFYSTAPLIWLSHSPDSRLETSQQRWQELSHTQLFAMAVQDRHFHCTDSPSSQRDSIIKAHTIRQRRLHFKWIENPALGTLLLSCVYHHFLSPSRSRVRAFLGLETGCRIGTASPKQSCHFSKECKVSTMIFYQGTSPKARTHLD